MGFFWDSTQLSSKSRNSYLSAKVPCFLLLLGIANWVVPIYTRVPRPC